MSSWPSITSMRPDPHKAAALSREALIRLQDAVRAGRISSQKYQQWHSGFQHRLKRLAAKIEPDR